jgi:hypothetical protein
MTSQLDTAAEARLAEAGNDLAKLDDAYKELAANAALTGASMLPFPAGTAADIVSFGRSLWGRDWGGALFDAVGIVPVLGDAIKGVGKGAKLANRLEDLEAAIKTARAALARQRAALILGRQKAAARYWNKIRTEGRAAYEKAIRNCSTQECAENLARLKGPQYQYTPRSGDNGYWIGERGDGVFVAKPGSRLDQALQEFNSKQVPPTRFDRLPYKNGVPDYTDFIFHAPGKPPARVEILQRGGKADFEPADDAYRDLIGNPKWERPGGYTWHHGPDGATMELVPTKLHGFPESSHAGGSSLMRQPEY